MKAAVLLLASCLCLAALAGAAAKPAYHLPGDAWRIDHGKRLRLPGGNPSGPVFFDLGECLLCHRPEKSCNICHRKLGLSPVPPSGGGK